MFRSLYSILLSLLTAKGTGSLQIQHSNGEEATVFLENGIITGIEIGDLQGVEAGKKIAMWVDFDTGFSLGKTTKVGLQTKISTKSYLGFLSKLDPKINKIIKIIPNNSTILQFLPGELNSLTSFNSAQLEVAMLLDGKRSVAEIIASTNQAELQALSHIFYLYSKGIAKVIEDKTPMKEEDRAEFLQSLKETLTDLLGPAADIIIGEALDTIGSSEDNIILKRIPDLIAVISDHLEPEDKTIFKTWADKHLKQQG